MNKTTKTTKQPTIGLTYHQSIPVPKLINISPPKQKENDINKKSTKE